MKFTKHVFVCTNQKPSPKKSCGEEHGMALVEAFKNEIKNRGLQIEIRAQRAGCLDTCGLGPTVAVYPDGTYYGNVSLADVPEIVEQHLVFNKVVERLKI